MFVQRNEFEVESFRNANILVTGGAGFVGSNLVRRLVELGANVTVLDNFFTGFKENLTQLPVQIIDGDVEDGELVKRLVQTSEYVFHLAVRNIIVSTKEPMKDFLTNVGGTLNVLQACLAEKEHIKRLVYTSSVSIYGNAKYLPINEDDPKTILNPYAASKLSAENYCMAYFETYEVPVSIVRYSNVYGPNQRPENPYCGVISKFIASAFSNSPLTVYGDGEQTRDFTFVDDAVDATVRAAIVSPGLVFNVGSGVETSINSLASTVISIIGSKSSVQYVDKRDIDDVRRRVLNIDLARRVLRWSPSTSLIPGLKKTIEWFESKKDEQQ
ncbi:NAD-dependent epimerase/dehydratase family protein [Coprothermobacter platensis]|uniref:NAD-dependent epimerase/dehydratase family protein n=1 Tax=Coprothermobacter platensis TaxID=108819 RepID=UPI00035CAB17|nr:NAD-dependent epimerase/dehydratase family protein [Coprothermobacter platensis]